MFPRYNILQAKELKQVDSENKDVRRLELLAEVEELQTELSQLDQKICTVEEQLANEEQSAAGHWEQYEDSRLRELMINAFRQRCVQERDSLTEDTRQIHNQRRDTEQLSRRSKEQLVFGLSDHGGAGTAAEPLVLRDVRELCNERVLFFQSLQENALKIIPSAEFSLEQRNAAYRHWISAVEDVLNFHPPNQVLLALQALASRQQRALEEKTASLNVEDDLSALGFRCESDHLLDMSVEEEGDLPPVSSLMQSAWEDVEARYLQLVAVRSRAQLLQTEVSALMKQAQLKLRMQDDPADPSTRTELEGRVVWQTAVRDSVREQCIHLQVRNRERQEALRKLRAQWQSVMDYRVLVDVRQEQIRSLIKGNSSVKAELACAHSELRWFVQEKLSPQFDGVIRAANGLRNSISQEAKLFSSVNLATLDCRVVARERVPVQELSLYRANSPAFRGISQSLSAPMYLAPEELCSHTASRKLELRVLRCLLHWCSTSLDAVQRRTAQLPAPSQQALLERMKVEDADVLQSLLPRVHELTHKCSKGLTYGSRVNTAITHWWEQPAQFVIPEMQREGLTFCQWLQRWKLATKGLCQQLNQ
ncbi:HAUS augmin-like complex subunit 5 isoform X2 [Electrophorus electricus]|uniref:HAUS augmin-like complex subunit 5 isoform X2 n=1 Tax=Electrophorus electricus TaxID=8005 RepID=UPI0015CFFEE3|nr:HAUS augmin-like complex subunit 5 isoform X2 [Electrophorus electricus]